MYPFIINYLGVGGYYTIKFQQIQHFEIKKQNKMHIMKCVKLKRW